MNTPKTVLNMLSNEQALKNCLWHRAFRCGGSAVAVVEALWASYFLEAVYHCRRLLQLADRYSAPRLEAACRRALYYGQANYRTIRRILQHGVDRLAPDLQTDIWGRPWI
jgi:hypothetical protein